MLPSIFGENLFDDFFDDNFGMYPMWNGRNPLYGKHAKNLMKTDVRETEDTYEVDVDLPGFKKDELSVELKDGYLTISAAKGLDKDEQDKKGKYIRQERYAGACSRSFYVGDVKPEEVSAKYEDGILKLTMPKQVKREQPKNSSIAIG
ncbi:MAG: Hsp20/alpha crystallin family protein [Pseudoflavonifractor capillosus]|uniref:Hsp20/alpha crystallin family protein n=1 Tax=Pseudoflavonifractor capillosus TaxID=106588 RepID=UPI0023F66138|nr:Hsp20/alpha crystallin family protein [Pseudoflavonifractor capillosus]MCI5927641.1 Hsp20/alpha crystallin family protein [Pseudoflavonifractor capillosus]MDY4662445.1 Hsp20/alpha crystallin family protein [Pseudoflavonifractor capillosus]